MVERTSLAVTGLLVLATLTGLELVPRVVREDIMTPKLLVQARQRVLVSAQPESALLVQAQGLWQDQEGLQLRLETNKATMEPRRLTLIEVVSLPPGLSFYKANRRPSTPLRPQAAGHWRASLARP